MQRRFDLQVILASQVPAIAGQSLFTMPVNVSIYNPAEHAVTFLAWASPMDTRADLLGVFSVCDTENGETLPLNTIKISRKLPATYEDLVEIPAGQTLEKTVHLTGLQLEKDHEYSVHAQGIWHAIWDKPVAEISIADLENLAEAQRGEFQSNCAFFRVQ